MATIYIDNAPYEADERRNLLDTCLSLGFDLPYFCWHPAMGSVGACRQCAVKQFKDESDNHGRIVMSCMTPAADGTRISVHDPEARHFRAMVIEWLMTNHPHDCPVCEEGGECHLQDMTNMSGHVYRRYRSLKRTFRNQALGPFIGHEMNRCITCYRCVRFYNEYAGGSDLAAFAAHNHVYFGRHADGTLESEFSGNLAEVCPTGVFTDKTFGAHYVRKWDLRSAPSVCVHCGLGCNTSIGERYGRLRRIVNRYNGAVNGYFLCDRGRFGYDFVNAPARVRRPLQRTRNAENARFSPADAGAAVDALREALDGSRSVVGIGSPRASIEANYALMHAVGGDRFHSGLNRNQNRLIRLACDILRTGPAHAASLRDVEHSDAVLVLGENLPDTAPRLALTLRQSVRMAAFAAGKAAGLPIWDDAAVRNVAQERRSPLFLVTPDTTRLDDIAAETWRAAPPDIARLGFAVAKALDTTAPDVGRLSRKTANDAARIADALTRAKRPTVIAGASLGEEDMIKAAASIAQALVAAGRPAQIMFALPEANSAGAALLGGGDIESAFRKLEAKQADTLIVVENDLFRRAPYARVARALNAARTVIVVDHSLTPTASLADWVLPAASFAEGAGTFISSEGRAQRAFQVFEPDSTIRESWRWLADAMRNGKTKGAASWTGLDDVVEACIAAMPELADIARAAPPAGYRIAGMRMRRAPHRYSGRTAMHAHVEIEEPRPAIDRDAPMTFTMEGHYGPDEPGSLLPFQWAPGWNSHQQSLPEFQREIGGSLKQGDPGVRLFEGRREANARYFSAIPRPFAVRRNQWLIVPMHEVFGSDELSRNAAALAQRIPAPYLALAEADAQVLGLGPGNHARIMLDGETWILPVRIRPALPAGIAGIPVGLGNLPAVIESRWTAIAPAGPDG